MKSCPILTNRELGGLVVPLAIFRHPIPSPAKGLPVQFKTSDSMITPKTDFPSTRPGTPWTRSFSRTFWLLVLALSASGLLSAQTAWNIHPDSPPGLNSNAKLKYANNSFPLVWQSSSSYPASVYYSDLKTPAVIPIPYTTVVNSQTMGVDPAPGLAKKLTIRYATSSGEYQAVVQDGFSLNIPSSGHTLVGPAQAVAGFVVVSATYGTTTTFVDVGSVNLCL